MHEAQQGAEWLSVYAATADKADIADTLLLPSLFLLCKKRFSFVYLPPQAALCCYCCCCSKCFMLPLVAQRVRILFEMFAAVVAT